MFVAHIACSSLNSPRFGTTYMFFWDISQRGLAAHTSQTGLAPQDWYHFFENNKLTNRFKTTTWNSQNPSPHVFPSPRSVSTALPSSKPGISVKEFQQGSVPSKCHYIHCAWVGSASDMANFLHQVLILVAMLEPEL